jgi:sodium/bile acid cotransporter 7
MYTSTGAWYTDVLPKEEGGYAQIYRRVFKQLGLSIFLPLVRDSIYFTTSYNMLKQGFSKQVVGQIIQNIWPKPITRTIARFKLQKLGSLALLLIIWSTYDQAFASRAFDSVQPSNMLFIVFISIALFFLFLFICFLTSILWLPKRDTISVCYCVPAKSPALGVPLANVLFVGLSKQVESKIQMPMVIYQGLQIFAGSLLTLGFRWWVRGDEEEEGRRIEGGGGDGDTRH